MEGRAAPKAWRVALGTALLLLLFGSSASQAGVITTFLTPFTGDPSSVKLTLDDMADPGNVKVTVDVISDTGDIRGVWLHIADESLVAGLSVINGAQVTGTEFAVNGVNNLGGGNNLNGGGSPCPCDIGVAIGDSGIGQGDDFQTTMFTLTHLTESLSVAEFAGQLAGVRLTSVGPLGGTRNGSSKMSAVVPEPATGVLFALGLAGMAAGRRRNRAGSRGLAGPS